MASLSWAIKIFLIILTSVTWYWLVIELVVGIAPFGKWFYLGLGIIFFAWGTIDHLGDIISRTPKAILGGDAKVKPEEQIDAEIRSVRGSYWNGYMNDWEFQGVAMFNKNKDGIGRYKSDGNSIYFIKIDPREGLSVHQMVKGALLNELEFEKVFDLTKKFADKIRVIVKPNTGANEITSANAFGGE